MQSLCMSVTLTLPNNFYPTNPRLSEAQRKVFPTHAVKIDGQGERGVWNQRVGAKHHGVAVPLSPPQHQGRRPVSVEKLEDAHPQIHIRLWRRTGDGEHSHLVGTISTHLQPALDLL